VRFDLQHRQHLILKSTNAEKNWQHLQCTSYIKLRFASYMCAIQSLV